MPGGIRAIDAVPVHGALVVDDGWAPVDADARSETSTDTMEAVLEMLGLPAVDDSAPLCMVEDDDVEDAPEAHSQRAIPQKERTARTVDLPRRCSRYLIPPQDCAAFVVDNFLSPAECRHLIHTASTTARGFQYVKEAAHTAPDGSTYSVPLQRPNPHKLSVFEHLPMVAKLWDSLRGQIEPAIKCFTERTNCGPPLGLNPRLRVLRYDASDDDRFEPHFDATTRVGQSKQSLLTVLIYLNEGGGIDFDGGETVYLDSIHPSHGLAGDDSVRLTPSTGTAVIFEHDLYHSSAPLTFGTKFVMRTDILFENRSLDDSGDDEPCSNRDQSTAVPNTVSDLCDDLDISADDRYALDGMELLDMTLESFLSPGLVTMKMILKDGLGEDAANKLLKEAASIVKRQ